MFQLVPIVSGPVPLKDQPFWLFTLFWTIGMLRNCSKNSILSFLIHRKKTVARTGNYLVSTHRQYLNSCFLKSLSYNVLQGSKLLFLVQHFCSSWNGESEPPKINAQILLNSFLKCGSIGLIFFPLLFRTHVSGGLGALGLLIMQKVLVK